jgi:hydroxyethylthiazole kinase-like sugar kinase family protein
MQHSGASAMLRDMLATGCYSSVVTAAAITKSFELLLSCAAMMCTVFALIQSY